MGFRVIPPGRDTPSMKDSDLCPTSTNQSSYPSVRHQSKSDVLCGAFFKESVMGGT